MQRALPGSLLAHAAIIGVGLIGFAWPQPDDAPAAESVNVSIISMSSVSSNATQVVQSYATENLVSSGTTAPSVEPVKPDTIEPVTDPITPLRPETPIEPLEPEPPLEQPAESEALTRAAPVTEVALLSSTAVASLTSQPLTATPAPSIEPVSSEDLNAAPIPRTLSFERPSEPTARPAPQQQPTPKPPTQSGNGGSNNADAVASAASSAQQAGGGSGGDAETARYPGEVLRKLRRALRSGNGPSGEVVVRFTVLANGQVAGVSIGRSSGNAAVDQAGLATVSRAAPFPPIPPQANRANWTFDVPLAFGG
jgi:protein TonB